VSLVRRPWLVVLFFAILIFASRIPLAPGQLFTFDDVNFAYSIGHYDIRVSQPHPPGYPLFVLEMRALWWLRFRQVQTLLFALALAGGVAALVLLCYAGNRMLGGLSGFYAACLLVFNPVFWHAGITSALRVQLAVVSVAVAACCWEAWRGCGSAVLWSAVALALGAGIRPEAGVLLFPLWAACALRAPVSWRDRARALGVMGGIVLVWLLPAMLASGGPIAFIRACLDYTTDQASVSSGLFGAGDRRWETTFWRMIVWTFCGVLGWSLPAVLAWRRHQGWGTGRDRLAFLGLWFLPAFAFGLLVHVEDPGHTLLMVPAVALCGGYLMNRASDNLTGAVSRGQSLIFACTAVAIAWIVDRHNAEFAVVWIPLACLAAGLLLKVGQVKSFGHLPRLHAFVFLFTPVLIVNWLLFRHQGWYYRGATTAGWRAAAERMTADLTSGVALTSYEQIHNTLAVDDHTIRAVRRLAAARPGATTVVWEQGLTAWRKICYYSPALPVAVLEHRKIRSGSPPVVALWRGPKLDARTEGPGPQRVVLAGGSRIVWALNPAADFYRLVQRSFPLTADGPVWYTDLPAAHDSRVVGDYEVVW
jgi:hypothetical protein